MTQQMLSIHEFGPYQIDAAKRLLLRDGEIVQITPKCFEILLVLVENSGVVLDKEVLMSRVWPDSFVEEGNLSYNISILRKTLGERPGEHQYIVTVPGRGYRFVASVKEVPAAGAMQKDTGPSESDTLVEQPGSKVQRLRDARQALGEDGSQYLRTERGRGYIFDPTPGGWSEEVDVVKVVIEEEEAEGEAAAFTPSPQAAIAAPPVSAWAARRGLAFSAAGLLVAGLIIGAAYYFFRSGTSRSTTAVEVQTLAVLPFKPLAPEGRDEALEVGMADSLIAKLGNIGVITVRPLGSVRRYGGLEQDPFDAGRQLGVEAVLDGTIHRSGDRVGVTVRLVRVGDGRQLWDGRFDAPFTDIFSVQDAISEKVAAALKPRLTSAEERRLAKHYTENVEAYQLYLRGRHHALKRTLPETQKAISYFQQAIAADPSYALAYVGLADAHVSALAGGVLPSNEIFPQARAAAQKAVEIDDTLAAAHAELGLIIFWYDWDWGASENKFKRALELDPDSADAHLYYAHLLSNTGRHAEALAEARRARELDPLNLHINALEGQFLLHAGRTDEALTRLHETLDMESNHFLARQYASRAYIDKGLYAEAIHEARRAREISGARVTHAEACLGYALAKSGKEAEARAILKGLLQSSAERYVSPYNIAHVYNALGERDEALAWLERAYAQRHQGIVFLKVESRWNNLRSDPRFQDLLRRVGLPP